MKQKLVVGKKTWDKASIKELLKLDQAALCRAVLIIYHQQTNTEQQAHSTVTVNGVGFNAYDAEFLTSIAKAIQQNRNLTEGQVAATRNKMLKYAGQLLDISIYNHQTKGAKLCA